MATTNLRVVIDALDRFVEQVIIKVSLDIVANLKRAPSEGGTPVDTGWARANWVPQIGAPFTGTAGSRGQAEAGSVSQAEQSAGEASLFTYRLERGQVWISNNVPYIVRLNEGSSRQAPAKFVEAAIQKAITVDLRTSLGRR